MEARTIDYAARKNALAKVFEFQPLDSLLITQKYLAAKLVEKKIVKEEDLQSLNNEEQSILLNKKLFDFIGFSPAESLKLSKQDIVSTLLSIIEFNPTDHLFLSAKNKDKLLSVIIKLCSDNNLSLIGTQVTNLHLLLDEVNTFEGLNAVHSYYNSSIWTATFVKDLLAYAKDQRVFIKEALDEKLSAENGVLTQIDQLFKKYDLRRKTLKNEHDIWAKSLQAPKPSVDAENKLEEKLSVTPNILNSSTLQDIKKSLSKINHAILDTIKILIDQDLFLPIIHAQQEILRKDQTKSTAMGDFSRQITSEYLFQIRDWKNRPDIIDQFLVWQAANPVIAALRSTTALFNSISDELATLSVAEIKKQNFSSNLKYLNLLLSTKNPHMQKIHDFLGLDKKIKQRYAFLQSDQSTQKSSAPTLHTRENSRALLLANIVEKEPKSGGISQVPLLPISTIPLSEIPEQPSPTKRRIEHVRKPAEDLRKEMAERRSTHVSLAQLRLSSIFIPPFKTPKLEESAEVQVDEELSSSSSSLRLSERSSH